MIQTVVVGLAEASANRAAEIEVQAVEVLGEQVEIGTEAHSLVAARCIHAFALLLVVGGCVINGWFVCWFLNRSIVHAPGSISHIRR